jgi:glutathione S-transferase
LNYKGVSFKTELIEYPDIEPISKKLGAKPTGQHPDGRPMYTIPFIYDEEAKTAVPNTVNIAVYLDERFPNTPSIVSPGTKGLQIAFIETMWSTVLSWGWPLWQPFLTDTSEETRVINKQTSEYFLAKFGPARQMTEEEHRQQVNRGEGALSKIAAWYEKGDMFISGTEPTIADFSVAAVVLSCRGLWGEGSEAYIKLCSWQDGQWGKLIAALQKYE